MNERIRQLVLDGLKNARECPAKTDIIEELVENLTEKYNDLIASGMDEEKAFEAVAASAGDLEEITEFINSSPDEDEARSSDPFSRLGDILRNMGRELKMPLKSISGSVRSAFGSQNEPTRFQQLKSEMRQPLQDMGHSIRKAASSAGEPLRDIANGLADTARQAADAFEQKYGCNADHDADSFCSDVSVKAEDVSEINIKTFSGDVEFFPSPDELVHISEYVDGNISQDMLASITLQDGVLEVQQGQSTAAGAVFFRHGVLNTRFEVFLPEKRWQALRVHTSSGDVSSFGLMDSALIEVRTVSGDIDLKALSCGCASLQTTSGDIFAEGTADEITVTSISGDVKLQGEMNMCSLHTTSGDMTFAPAGIPAVAEIVSVSGDVKFVLCDNPGFTVKYKTVSGDLRSDYPLMTSLDRRNGCAVYGTGEHVYSIRTVSGDMVIRRK